MEAIQADGAGQPTCQAAAHLHRGPLAPGRAAEEMRGHGGEQNQRSHAAGNAGLRIVDFFQDEIVAALTILARPVIHQADGDAADGQQIEQPGMGQARVGGILQTAEKDRRRRAAQTPTRRQDGPLTR